MPRKLKVYQTSLGFFDLAIAAPSMKAALEAWGAGSNLFHQGVAKESNDRKVIDAAMKKPGTICRKCYVQPRCLHHIWMATSSWRSSQLSKANCERT
jgi:hypothetical protein